MRIWIRTILDSPALLDDFVSWAEDIERTLATKMAEAARKSELDKVQQLAIELAVYSDMRQKFQAEKREAVAVNDYLDRKQ